MTIHQEQITFNIRRPLNTGLGISIAGGLGSSAYKDNDYVRKLYFYQFSFHVNEIKYFDMYSIFVMAIDRII